MTSSLANYLNVGKIRMPQWLDEERFLFSYNRSGIPQVWEGNVREREILQRSDYQDFITTILSDPVSQRWAFAMADGGNERSQIFIAEKDGNPYNLTDKPEAVHMLGAFIPDTNLLLFSSNLRNSNHFDLETIDVISKERTLVLENNDNYNFVESVSPDGRYYVYRKLIGESDQPLWCYDTHTNEVFPIPAQPSKAKYDHAVWLDSETLYFLSNADHEFMALVKYHLPSQEKEIILKPNWDIETFGLSSDKQYISVVINEEGYHTLHIYNRETMQRTYIPLPPQGSITFYDHAVWSPSGHRLLFSFSSGTHVPNIWMIDVDEDCCCRLTQNTLAKDARLLVEPMLRRYVSFDGLSVPYWLYVPAGKPVKDLPVLIEIHGGPEGQEKASFDEIVEYIVSEGIAVVAPNVRGSTGYGKTYTHLDDVEKRLDSVADIEALVAHLVSEGIADKDKIAVSGTSYGGFMTLSCAARYPDLFCAAVDTVGMYNLVTFLERTAGYRRAHRESEYGSLERDRDTLYHVSPVAKVDDIQGPLLVIHGTNDPRVPVYEAQQAVRYLREKGVEVDYLEYEDEGHGLNKLKNRLDCYPRVIAFLKEKMGI